MPKKSGNFDQNKYIQQFVREKEVHKRVVFNKESDSDLLEWLDGKAFSPYVKELLREKMTADKARAEYDFHVAKTWASLKDGITIPFVDGYRNEEAIRKATEEEHNIYVHYVENWEIRIDSDEKKVLTVDRR